MIYKTCTHTGQQSEHRSRKRDYLDDDDDEGDVSASFVAFFLTADA